MKMRDITNSKAFNIMMMGVIVFLILFLCVGGLFWSMFKDQLPADEFRMVSIYMDKDEFYKNPEQITDLFKGYYINFTWTPGFVGTLFIIEEGGRQC